jgi:hypothetical protein
MWAGSDGTGLVRGTRLVMARRLPVFLLPAAPKIRACYTDGLGAVCGLQTLIRPGVVLTQRRRLRLRDPYRGR